MRFKRVDAVHPVETVTVPDMHLGSERFGLVKAGDSHIDETGNVVGFKEERRSALIAEAPLDALR